MLTPSLDTVFLVCWVIGQTSSIARKPQMIMFFLKASLRTAQQMVRMFEGHAWNWPSEVDQWLEELHLVLKDLFGGGRRTHIYNISFFACHLPFVQVSLDAGTSSRDGGLGRSSGGLRVWHVCGAEGACPVLWTPTDPKAKRDRVGRIESKLVKGAGAQEEVGGDKHVSGQHMYVHSRQGGGAEAQGWRGSDLHCSTKEEGLGHKDKRGEVVNWGSSLMIGSLCAVLLPKLPHCQMGLLPSVRLSRTLYELPAIWVADHGVNFGEKTAPPPLGHSDL